MKKINVYDICFIGCFVSIALALDNFVKIPLGQTGGSINFATLPLIFICLKRGYIKGLFACLIYSFLSCILDAYGFQFLVFDYIIPFCSITLVSILSSYFKENINTKKAKCILYLALVLTICFIIRVLSASIDSVLFYETTYFEGIIYNVTYCGLSTLATLVISIIVFPSLYKININS